MSLSLSTSLSWSIILPLILILTLPSPSSSSSDIEDRSFQILDVSTSLQQAREVFSQSLLKHQKQKPLTLNSSSSSSLSLTLHSLSSLLLNSGAVKNYTSLTLSRLARDEARVRRLLSSHSLSLSRSSKEVNGNRRYRIPVTSGVAQGSGEYLARVGVGRPVKEFYMAIDTGSDISWLQCRPCAACYPQSDPIFNPAASSTYRPLACGSRQCAALDSSACFGGSCLYQVAYGDGSSTVGDFATETITFGSSGSVAGVAVGCGHDNEGLFLGSAGLLGLGGGPLSLPSQIKAASFSYCLVSRDSGSSSTLDFDSAEPAGSIVAPMLTNSFVKTYRYVGLTGISVGGRPVRLRRGAFALRGRGRGGVIVDSGTTVTRFPAAVYGSVRDAFRSMARDLRYAGGVSILDTCYDFSGMTTVRVPTVSFQFSGGESLPLPARNYLIPVDDRGTHCLAFAGTAGSMSIIGNTQQQGTRVSYNLVKKYIAFSPNNC